jgi:uncharacterized membrane protein YidH (DUF202 family)
MVARVGLVARGVIYVVLAYLSLDIALHGSSPSQTSGQGALDEVAHQPGGVPLLIVTAVGLAAYAAWRLLQSATGQPGGGQGRSVLKRIGWLGTAIIYSALCVQALDLASGSSSKGSSQASNPRPWAAVVLGWPAGPELLGLAGAALVSVGIALAVWGCAHDHRKELQLERLTTRWQTTVRALAGVGNTARGFLVVLVGAYLLDAAVASKPSKAKSVDAALQSLAHHEYGAILLGVVAAGLLCFGVYSFFEAGLRRL